MKMIVIELYNTEYNTYSYIGIYGKDDWNYRTGDLIIKDRTKKGVDLYEFMLNKVNNGYIITNALDEDISITI